MPIKWIMCSVFGFVAVTGLMVGGWLININNTCVRYEQTIPTQFQQNKNIYDNYFKKVKEAAQVPDAYIEGLKQVFDSAMKGRYGEEGSRAVFQWIQEQNPRVDPIVYKKIQDIIEAGRNEFAASQRTLLDIKNSYGLYRKPFPTSWAVKKLGYPAIDLDKYDIVTSQQTDDDFNSKKSDPIKLK